METKRINEHYYSIEDGGVRFFLVLGDKFNLMIDSGMSSDEGLDIAKSLCNGPIRLVNTHCDRDHIAGNGKFAEALMHKDELPLYSLGNGKAVEEGDVIDTGYVKFKVIHIPGHTPGSIALFDEERGILVGGDSIQRNYAIFMFGPARNIPDKIESLRKLSKIKGIDKVFASHGDLELPGSYINDLIEVYEHLDEFPVESVDMFGHKIHKVNCGFVSILIN